MNTEPQQTASPDGSPQTASPDGSGAPQAPPEQSRPPGPDAPVRGTIGSEPKGSSATGAPAPALQVLAGEAAPIEARRFVCIHGHFYQPPRENPWLEAIELQDSAYPYHDWNERITAECYEPNAASRIVDADQCITSIPNNYAHISFNFGPTLLSWMKSAEPDTYRKILEADRTSMERFGGHGSAMAQGYSHSILPLSNRRDKVTQVRWGVRDFESRFGRMPEGMWLPEAAVDLETLDILVDHGIRFTVLAPNQAHRARAFRARNWKDVSGGRIDPFRVYEQVLPSGRRIALFFYDGVVARAVAFEGLLASGDALASRLLGAIPRDREEPALEHIATDGESYGHHHRLGDMALAFALQRMTEDPEVRLINYGQYLEMHPPSHQVEIFENSSWSCVHGIERWRSNCGCNTGGRPGWTQEWRAPLRAALDWLRDRLAPDYEAEAGKLLKDPWDARDDYIDVILDRSPEVLARFKEKHAVRELSGEETVRMLELLEMQRHAMLMYTSCGWFFTELSGIETVQVIMYAGRALQLAQKTTGKDYEQEFLSLLEKAHSNIPEFGNGRNIYDRWVRPAEIDLVKVGGHYAISSMFKDYQEHDEVYAFEVDREEYRTAQAGTAKLAVGRIRVTSRITRDSAHLATGTVHLGEHNLTGGVRLFNGNGDFEQLVADTFAAFERAELPDVIRELDRNFSGLSFSIRSLFRDEQRNVLDRILSASVEETELSLSGIYDRFATLMQFLRSLGTPPPRPLLAAAESALHLRLRRAFSADELDQERILALLKEAEDAGIPIDRSGLGYRVELRLEKVAERLLEKPRSLSRLNRLYTECQIVPRLGFEINLRKVQNVYFEILRKNLEECSAIAASGDDDAREWTGRFADLANVLKIRIPEEALAPLRSAEAGEEAGQAAAQGATEDAGRAAA